MATLTCTIDRKTAPVKVAVGAASAASTQLAEGIYEIISTTACYIRQGASTVEATADMHYLPIGDRVLIRVTQKAVDGYVAAIRATADGSLFIAGPRV